MLKRVLIVSFILGFLGTLIWATDRVTLDGERTIYTVNCERGVWEGLKCRGTFVAGERYRYLSHRSRHEVIFWIAGSPESSGKYTDCTVKDRGNWSCKVSLDKTPSITREMANDKATHDQTGRLRPFHAVPKWKWWLLRAGFPGLSEASY